MKQKKKHHTVAYIRFLCFSQVLQVFGHKNGLDMLERADPLVLLIGLPAIPAGLILGRMICWEEMLLRFIQSRQNIARKFPILNLVLPNS